MSTLNFQRALAIGFIVRAAAVVSGCASSVPILSDLVGSKPDMTAQVGAENVKQAVGVTNKTDTSSKQETTFKESAVGKVDTSNKKSVTTSSIHANQITADKIEIRNDESGSLIPWLIGGVGAVMLAIGVFGLWRERKNKGA
nr:Rz-like spanin [Przondovirus K11]